MFKNKVFRIRKAGGQIIVEIDYLIEKDCELDSIRIQDQLRNELTDSYRKSHMKNGLMLISLETLNGQIVSHHSKELLLSEKRPLKRKHNFAPFFSDLFQSSLDFLVIQSKLIMVVGLWYFRDIYILLDEKRTWEPTGTLRQVESPSEY